MERLTKRKVLDDKEINIVDGDACYDTWAVPKKFAGPAIDRLAAYEDTGLEPVEVMAVKLALMGTEIAKITEFDGVPIERLKELAQAEKDRRLAVLAVRPGRVALNANRIFYVDDGKVCTDFVEHVTIYEDKHGELRCLYETDNGWFRFDSFDIYDRAFFTEAEAETALEREGGTE